MDQNQQSYTDDSIRAVDAKFEAQKLAFAPLVFQALRALEDLGILRNIADAGGRGLSREEAAEKAGVSPYGAGVLADMALELGVLRLNGGRYVLGKIGWFFLEDDMTRANFNFSNDVCYRGAFELGASVKAGRPLGLGVFGNWDTIYEALSSLPEKIKESWFAFDHFYSDLAFPEALPLVFARDGGTSPSPRNLIDIGGNTAKWAIRCCQYNTDVEVTIVDLPGQTALAEQNAAAAGFSSRIKTLACNILGPQAAVLLPRNSCAIWMSQFLDCFSPEEISRILGSVYGAAGPETDVWVLEPFCDKQRFAAASYSLRAASLYFTCMANGRSKMYCFEELNTLVEGAGFVLAEARHDIGANSYSLLRYRKRQ